MISLERTRTPEIEDNKLGLGVLIIEAVGASFFFAGIYVLLLVFL